MKSSGSNREAIGVSVARRRNLTLTQIVRHMKFSRFTPLVFTLVTFTSIAAEEGCSVQTPVNSGNVSVGQLHSFFGQIVALCKGRQQDAYFNLLTTNRKIGLTKNMPPDRRASVLAQNCQFILDASRSIGERPENGTHSIETTPGRQSVCGLPQTYWYIHTKGGERVFRLKLAMENGQIRIDDN